MSQALRALRRVSATAPGAARPPQSGSKDVAQIGLGLSFCKLVVEAHGGRIEAGANEPCGTTIVVEI